MITSSGIYGRAFRKAAITCAGLLLCAAFGGSALAGDLPKQGTHSYSWTFSGPYEVIQVGEDEWAWVAHYTMASWNDAGEGLFHNMSGDCIGVGLGEEESGYCTYVDADGDMIFEAWQGTGAGTGTDTLLGGTGKYVGLQGTAEYEYVYFPDNPEGTFLGKGHSEGSYTLP